MRPTPAPQSAAAASITGSAARCLTPQGCQTPKSAAAASIAGRVAGRRRWLAAALACAAAAASAADGPITVRDDQGRHVTLQAPARRAISTAPHATELAYAAGAGGYLAGTVLGSDYPPEARALPSIGDSLRPGLERAVALRPDLLIAWQPAVPEPLPDLMRRLGVPVYYSDPRTLAAIADSVETLGRLFGTEAQAGPAAAALRARLAALQARYAGRQPVRVFIQAGLQPLYTLNGASIVSDAVRLCGGINVFADAPVLAPQVSLESVLAARPQAVVAGVLGPADAEASRRAWRGHGLPAAAPGQVISLDADMLYRPGPRLVDAAEQLCAALDQARR